MPIYEITNAKVVVLSMNISFLTAMSDCNANPVRAVTSEKLMSAHNIKIHPGQLPDRQRRLLRVAQFLRVHPGAAAGDKKND